MKRTLLLLLVLSITLSVFAVKVFTNNGKEYNGELISTHSTAIVLNDEEIQIEIPLSKIKEINDNGRNITKEIMEKAAAGSGTDSHYINTDEYFISENALDKGQWIYVKLAKMTTPASEKTKMEAEFLTIPDGRTMWTKYYYKTKVVKHDKLKIGDLVIVMDMLGDNNAYRAPQNEDEARNTAWFLARVTDMNSAYKGYITVSGGYNITLDNLRSIVK